MAFLYGKLDKEIYMLTLERLGNLPNKCVKLEKFTWIGASDTAILQVFVKTLKKVEFNVLKADPCLLMQGAECGTVFLLVGLTIHW